jgi:hypothetical protein
LAAHADLRAPAAFSARSGMEPGHFDVTTGAAQGTVNNIVFTQN